ncbi:MAG: class I SAM-dependent methyltransferase [Planctomycetes bacterium]|nr:class I SAM-dependent methyltransferase [Planctomycetota bacterium]
MSDDVAERMRRDWNQRARDDARHFIATGESEGALFALSGCRDTYRMLEDQHSWLRPSMRSLEIGCGIGRLVQFFARIFAEAHGIDVSSEMVERGRAYLKDVPNAHLHLGDGSSLPSLADASFDFVVSYVVFQHIPSKEVIRSYVKEAHRVLKPGGRFKYLVKNGRWAGEGAEPDTWHGATITIDDVEAWHGETGLRLLNAYSETESTAWVVAEKPALRAGEEALLLLS